jgi:hypothetical protein
LAFRLLANVDAFSDRHLWLHGAPFLWTLHSKFGGDLKGILTVGYHEVARNVL